MMDAISHAHEVGLPETGLVLPDGLVHGTVLTTKPMTSAQRRVLHFIHRYIQERGYAPGLRDIGASYGSRSTNGPAELVRKLEQRGFLLVGTRISRGLRITVEGYAALGIKAEANPATRTATSSERLELIASRRDAARLRTLLARTVRATLADLPAVIADIRKELGE